MRGPGFESQGNYFSISIAVSLWSFPESPDLDFFSNGASRDCVTKCDLQRNLQRQRLKQLLRSTVNTPINSNYIDIQCINRRGLAPFGKLVVNASVSRLSPINVYEIWSHVMALL
jgi:hypothetical protein